MPPTVEEICALFAKGCPDVEDFVAAGTCGGTVQVLAVHGESVESFLRDKSLADIPVVPVGSRFTAQPVQLALQRGPVRSQGASALPKAVGKIDVMPGLGFRRGCNSGGSVGCLMKAPGSDTCYFLTAGHSLLDPKQSDVTAVDRYLSDRGEIGTVRAQTDISKKPAPQTDWGLVTLDKTLATGKAVSGCLPGVAFKEPSPSTKTEGQTVWKCGNATGLRDGMVCAADWCALVDYKFCDQYVPCVRFDHNIVVRSFERKCVFAADGDSGAVVYLQPEANDKAEAVGLVIATTANHSYALVAPLVAVFAEVRAQAGLAKLELA